MRKGMPEPSVPTKSEIVQFIISVAAVGFQRQDWSGDLAYDQCQLFLPVSDK